MDWEEIAKFGVATISLSGFIAWLSRSLFMQWFNKDLAKYKTDLIKDTEKFKNDLSLVAEQHKSYLVRTNNEHSVKFSMLHEKRAEVIEKLYSCVLEARVSVDVYPEALWERSDELKEKHSIQYFNAISGISDYIREKRLFFSKEVLALIEDFANCTFNEPINRSYDFKSYEGRELTQEERVELHNKHKESVDKLNRIQERLEEEFRKLLGVN